MMDEVTSPQLTDVIRVKVGDNPKRVGTKSYLRYEHYADGITVSEYVDAVRQRLGNVEAKKCLSDLKWDTDPNRAFIAIERNGKPIDLRRPPSMSYGRARNH